MARQSQLVIRHPRHHLFNILPGIFLSLLMVWAVVRSIVVSNWADGLDLLVIVAIPALLAGVIFSTTRWIPTWIAHLLSVALSIAWIIDRIGPLLDPRLVTWRDQATELLIRILILGRVLANGGRGEDIVLFVVALALVAACLGYATAWYVFRYGWIWWAILINAVAILVNYAYALPKPTGLFFLFLTTALLLLVYHHVITRVEYWSAARIEYPDFLPIRFVTTAAFVCGAIIFSTSRLPSHVTSEQAEQTWQTMKQPFVTAREYWEDAFSTINSPADTVGSSFTRRSAELGGGRVLGDGIVMYVQSSQFEYWRAVAFDKYTSRGWENTTGEQARALMGVATQEQARTSLEPGMSLPLDNIQGRMVVTQTVRLATDRKDDFLVTGGQAFRSSLPTLVEHDYKVVQNQLQPNFDDTALIMARVPLRANTVYTVTSLVSIADIQGLRQAGTAYPDWVRRRYLQLPGTVTPRTIARARQLVREAGAETPYDQAIAIQDFLRTYPYNDQIPAPPVTTDPVDYFLFEQREGYCDYYASAMVVMLRSLDIPARWVQGYAGGLFDAEQKRYVVRENIAHSWPEVYFPEYGWQRFEPTPASYASLPLRPLMLPDPIALDATPEAVPSTPPASEPTSEAVAVEELPITPTDASTAQVGIWQHLVALRRVFAGIALVLGLAGITIAAVILRWRYETRGLSPAATAYAQIELLAYLAGLPQAAHMTPQEYATRLIRAMPHQRHAVERIVSTYIDERYRRSRHLQSPDMSVALKQVRRTLVHHILARWTGGLWPYADRKRPRLATRR